MPHDTHAKMASPAHPVQAMVLLCIPDDQVLHAPKRRRAPAVLPDNVPLPRVGEFVYLSSSSAWIVRRVVHEWRSAVDLRIELWLDWAGSARAVRHADFSVTQ